MNIESLREAKMRPLINTKVERLAMINGVVNTIHFVISKDDKLYSFYVINPDDKIKIRALKRLKEVTIDTTGNINKVVLHCKVKGKQVVKFLYIVSMIEEIDECPEPGNYIIEDTDSLFNSISLFNKID